MYRTPAFAVDDQRWCVDFIKRYNFGLFQLGGQTTPMAFVMDEAQQVLFGHLARANPQAGRVQNGAGATAFFLGPHGYVSPSCYEAPAVPTWNYQAVEVRGSLKLIDGEGLTTWLARLVRQEEAAIGGTWSMDQLPEGHVEKLHKAIVGFELSIESLQGKAKLSQNKSVDDQDRVVAAFHARGLHALAGAMQES
ncbi:MAG: FMN-binding negative transcriptional regulator [Alphaproteobacteria bacterium]